MRTLPSPRRGTLYQGSTPRLLLPSSPYHAWHPTCSVPSPPHRTCIYVCSTPLGPLPFISTIPVGYALRCLPPRCHALPLHPEPQHGLHLPSIGGCAGSWRFNIYDTCLPAAAFAYLLTAYERAFVPVLAGRRAGAALRPWHFQPTRAFYHAGVPHHLGLLTSHRCVMDGAAP